MNDQAFDGVAGIYDDFRPNYPQELIAEFRDAFPLPTDGGIVLDVGSGTGIATRQLRELFPDQVVVIGIEPGDDMRRTAVSNSDNHPNLAFLNFPAENLPFANGTVNGVFVAQALHWFDRPKFYAEAARVLWPGGVLGLIENNRNWRESAFLDDYETLLEMNSVDYGRHYRSFDIRAELEKASDLIYVGKRSSSHVLKMPKRAFFSWSFSSSKMQACIRNVGGQKVRDLLAGLVEKYYRGKTAVEILYETELYLASRKI